MENHNDKVGSNGGAKTNPNIQSNSVEQLENPNSNSNSNHADGDEYQQESATRGGGSSDLAQQSPHPSSPNSARRSSRTPFTNLSQIDADLALARTLQEQERAYMMLQMNNEGSDYGSWEAGSYPHDEEGDYNDFNDDTDADDVEEEEYEGTDTENNEDAFDVHAHNDDEEGSNPSVELDPADFSSDEAYARALQDADDREVTARLMSLAGIHDREVDDTDDNDGRSQDTWGEVDPDELSYEELLALGDVVGCASRGLSADTIASLPSVNYKTGSSQNGSNDLCVICRLDYEDDETLTVLSCKHSYHSECINNWLKINKICPFCSTEVSTSGNSQ